MFIKLFLIGIILYIIIIQFFGSNNQSNNNLMDDNNIQSPIIQSPIIQSHIIQSPIIKLHQSSRLTHNIQNKSDIPQYKVQEFDNPNPWTKIVYVSSDDYPYHYHIKIVIPSLNDFEQWKQVIPNIDLNPTSRELIIPSKDEASALAIANLICINFSGQMTMQNILDKDLIRISIMKAQSHDVVKHKLKEQIMEVLYGKIPIIETKYDTAKNIKTPKNNVSNKQMSLKSDNFSDTFQHFSEDINNNEIDGYDNSNYSYI